MPELYYIGTDQSNPSQPVHILIMDLLGPSIEDLFQACKKEFDLKTVILLAKQFFEIIQKVHEERIIHRDIKPDNFVIGHRPGTKDDIYLIDFGLAKHYIDASGNHIKWKDSKSLTGTARYASVTSHKGIEQSRRDDLESIVYMILYLKKGSLPWQNLPNGRSK